MNARLAGVLAACALSASFGAQAHHSYSEFDQTRTVEIEGALVNVALHNPMSTLTCKALELTVAK